MSASFQPPSDALGGALAVLDRHRLILTVSLCLIACSSMTGCAAPSDEDYATPVQVTPPGEGIVYQIGAASDGSGLREFAAIKTAVLSESGRFLAVADRRAPPYLRIVDRESDAVVAFGPRGGGPAELRSAEELTFSGDTLLLVLAGGGRLELFSATGEWRRGFRVPDAGVTLSSITNGCGGKLYGYGVPTGSVHVRPDTVPWVHELTIGETLTAEPRAAFVKHGVMGWGGLFGFSGSADGILVWRKATNSGYWVPCGEAVPELWSPALNPKPAGASEAEGGMVFVLPDTLFAGAAATGNRRIWARTYAIADNNRETAIRVVSEGTCSEVRFPGKWTVHDAQPVGLVLSVDDPAPTVKIIAWSWLSSQLRKVRCPAMDGA
jgi:hypothetical protein